MGQTVARAAVSSVATARRDATRRSRPNHRFRNSFPSLGKPLTMVLGMAAVLAVWTVGPSQAEEEPIFRIEFKDGAVAPMQINVPANARFRLELANVGLSPVEFESVELRKEKVVAPGTTSVLVIRTLDPGEYSFFDDFHPGSAPAKLVAK